MEIEMRNSQKHEELIVGRRYTIITGQVENGWWWECFDVPYESDGAHKTREAALKEAIDEITARTKRN